MLRFTLIWAVFFTCTLSVQAQQRPEITRHKFKIGPKAGMQMQMPRDLRENLSETINIRPTFGFNVGGIMNYKVTKRFSLHTELAYVQRNRHLEGGTRDLYNNRSTYSFIELPVLCRVTYEGSGWSWYFNGGGNFSYWLSGRGSIYSWEFQEAGQAADEPYAIRFAEKPEGYQPEYAVYLEQPNRIQLGIDLGFGFYFSVAKKQHFNLDFRLTQGQSWMALDKPVDMNLTDQKEDLRHSFRTLSVNLGWLFDFDPMDLKKGRSSRK
jgi:hypothetical protein